MLCETVQSSISGMTVFPHTPLSFFEVLWKQTFLTDCFGARLSINMVNHLASREIHNDEMIKRESVLYIALSQ